MKKQLFSFLLLLSFVFNVSAQKAQQAKPDASENNLRTHVSYLASDKLEGRRTGETGATFAAGYVANMFANYKLKAGFNQKSKGKAQTNFLQSFPFVTGVEMAETGNAFSVDVTKTGGQRLNYENGLAFKPVGFSPNAEIGNTEAVFVGYGIVSNELKYDDYKNSNINGRIVLAFDGSAENDNPHSQFGRFDARAKARIAKEKGAIGLILISRETKFEDDKLAQLRYDQTLGEAALPTIVVSRKTGADILGIDEARLKSLEENYIAAAKGAGVINSELPINSKAIVSFKINLVRKQADAYNVIGILEGTDPVLRNEAIIIGAHYDHLGRGGAGSLAANSTQTHHGADDNASGVAGLIELARQFSAERKNKRTLIFIAFGGEEEGLLGSKFYTNNPVFPLDKTVAMFNMDMIGRLNGEKLTIGGVGTAGEWKKLIESINSKNTSMQSLAIGATSDVTAKVAVEGALKRKGFDAVIIEATPSEITLRGIIPKGKMAEVVMTTHEIGKRKVVNQLIESSNTNLNYSETIQTIPFIISLNEDGFGPSDHSSFYGKQIPVLFFFTGTHTDYHKPSDTAEKINYDGLLKITNFVADIVKTIDQNAKRPTYAVAKSSGMMGGRTGFNVSLGTIPSYAESNDGLVLDGVRENSPAAKAGLKAGDKITKLAGKEIRNVSDYTFVLGEMKADVEYEIEIARGADKLTLKIVPAARK